jgi:hypothetical protein
LEQTVHCFPPAGFEVVTCHLGEAKLPKGLCLGNEMPVWELIFQYLDNYNEAAVRQRIKNLCDFIE